MSYDIIADIHGHAERLEALLGQLGCSHRNGAWRHPERTVIFVGDFIDRGPQQLRTLGIVRDMMQAGSAQAVMGNHELNAIGFATPDPERPGEFLRRRSEKNTRQHAAFLAEVGCDSALHRSWVDWFLTLPLWIETPQFRVVHACWDPGVVAAAQPWLRGSTRLPRDHLPLAFTRTNPLHTCAEVLLKGPEAELPARRQLHRQGGARSNGHPHALVGAGAAHLRRRLHRARRRRHPGAGAARCADHARAGSPDLHRPLLAGARPRAGAAVPQGGLRGLQRRQGRAHDGLPL